MSEACVAPALLVVVPKGQLVQTLAVVNPGLYVPTVHCWAAVSTVTLVPSGAYACTRFVAANPGSTSATREAHDVSQPITEGAHDDTGQTVGCFKASNEQSTIWGA